MKYQTNNIFAKILQNQEPCIKVYEDLYTITIMDIMPQTNGHMLVIPREYSTCLFDLSKEVICKTIMMVQQIAHTAKKVLNADGIKIIQMNGSAAGQTIFHCHFHVIPCYSNNKSLNNTNLNINKQSSEENLQTLAKKISKALII